MAGFDKHCLIALVYRINGDEIRVRTGTIGVRPIYLRWMSPIVRSNPIRVFGTSIFMPVKSVVPFLTAVLGFHPADRSTIVPSWRVQLAEVNHRTR